MQNGLACSYCSGMFQENLEFIHSDSAGHPLEDEVSQDSGQGSEAGKNHLNIDNYVAEESCTDQIVFDYTQYFTDDGDVVMAQEGQLLTDNHMEVVVLDRAIEGKNTPIPSNDLTVKDTPETNAPRPSKWIDPNGPKCHVCHKTFPSRAVLQYHLNSHSGIQPFICAECGKGFSSKYLLTSHLKIHTERPRPFKCSHCDKAFVKAKERIRHERTHDSLELPCRFCPKLFKTPQYLKLHEKKHQPHQPFICSVCGKALSSKYSLGQHERLHSEERPHVCDVCGSAFAQKANLLTHMRTIHLEEAKFSCEQCTKTFKRRRLLDCHVSAVHLKERFQCNDCPKSYFYLDHLRKHIKRKHGEDKAACKVGGDAVEKE